MRHSNLFFPAAVITSAVLALSGGLPLAASTMDGRMKQVNNLMTLRKS